MLNSPDYKVRVAAQIAQYADVENMHDELPAVFHHWQKNYFKPRLREVFNCDNHIEFYVSRFEQHLRRSSHKALASIGSGDGAVELQVARALKQQGIDDFTFDLVELSPIQLERAEHKIKESGMLDNFRFIEADFNQWKPDKSYAGVMAHHALHHVQELENLFDAISDAMTRDSVFCTFDMIGRNGHMRWPEALEFIERIWAFLPDSKKFHRKLKQVETEFVNRDYSTSGFEGIRAQDILPLLVERFGFSGFVGFGNLIDTFTTRAFGANFDMEDEHDRAFIDFVQYLNDVLLDLGHVKPTRMCAAMVLDKETPPQFYGNLSPKFAVRKQS